ncbi:hypothetical protein NT6N_13370 [Oceaniferula spumae]|uniref:Ice-binding protein C-terminal domain-containing protein n=1 Tax=Oceaniferula spumae TaxID=2979115 RepID=A0AAT9FK18_9BACT
MKNKTTLPALSLMAGALFLTGSAHAALVHADGNVTLVSTTGFASAATGITNASDGNTELNNNGQVNTNQPGAGGGSDYFANAPSIVFDLDLGTTFTLDAVALWNKATVNESSIKDFNVVFSTNNTFGDIDDSSVFSFTSTQNAGTQEDYSLGTLVTDARYVRVTITDNFEGNGGGGGDRAGFTEFQFNAVPEPSSTALLGLGGLALILRRRR